MTLIADLFPKLRTPEKVVRYMSKKSSFKGPSARQHVKRVQTLLRSGQTALLPYLLIIWKVIESQKVCFSQTQSLITGFNTLTADDKYSLLNKDKFNATNSDQIIAKTKSFFTIFYCIFEMCIKFLNIFKKKMTLIADLFPKLRTPENWLDIYPKSPVSKDPLLDNNVKRVQTLFISGEQHCYHIY